MDVILHIGPHKTGSSSIQSALRKNVPSLRGQGFLTANDAEQAASALPLLFQSERAFHPRIRRLHPTWGQAQGWSEQHWVALEQQARSLPDHTAIISSEHFSSLADPAPLIARLRRTFDKITVISYVRDPVDLYVSSIQQNIRGGRRLVDLHIPSDFPFGIRRQIDRYAAAVGQQNVVVRNFSRDNLVGGDIVLDFFATVSQLGRPVALASSFVNEAFPGAVVAWLMVMNESYERVVETDLRIELLDRLDSIAELKAFPKLRLDLPDFIAAIRARTRDDCQWLNTTCLQGQRPLHIEQPALSAPLTADSERLQLRQWILQALTPEALALLLSATIRIARPDAAAVPRRRATKAATAAVPDAGNRRADGPERNAAAPVRIAKKGQ